MSRDYQETIMKKAEKMRQQPSQNVEDAFKGILSHFFHHYQITKIIDAKSLIPIVNALHEQMQTNLHRPSVAPKIKSRVFSIWFERNGAYRWCEMFNNIVLSDNGKIAFKKIRTLLGETKESLNHLEGINSLECFGYFQTLEKYALGGEHEVAKDLHQLLVNDNKINHTFFVKSGCDLKSMIITLNRALFNFIVVYIDIYSVMDRLNSSRGSVVFVNNKGDEPHKDVARMCTELAAQIKNGEVDASLLSSIWQGFAELVEGFLESCMDFTWNFNQLAPEIDVSCDLMMKASKEYFHDKKVSMDNMLKDQHSFEGHL